jgi:hypothetical protein
VEITYLKHNQIDKAKWDECIDHSHNRIVYAQSWYLDIVSKGWEALVSADYETVMPLTYGNKYGIKYLYQPFFTQQLGIFSRNESTQKLEEEFLISIPSKFKLVDIALNKGNAIQSENFQTKNNVNYELKLDKTYSEIASGYSSNTKRNIYKAAQHKLSVIHDVSTGKLIRLFRSNLGKGIKNIKDVHYQLLKQIMDKSLLEQNAEIYGVNSIDGELCAGAFFLKSYDSYIFLFSATNDESKENGAMFMIIDQFIRTHADEKITLDFEGSNIKNLARFYKSFGADEFNYLRIKKNNLPRLLRIFKS